MPQVKYTAFHVDFSTLDIEHGSVSLRPSQFARVVLPQAMPGRITVQSDDEQKGTVVTIKDRVPSARRTKASRSRRMAMRDQKPSS